MPSQIHHDLATLHTKPPLLAPSILDSVAENTGDSSSQISLRLALKLTAKIIPPPDSPLFPLPQIQAMPAFCPHKRV